VLAVFGEPRRMGCGLRLSSFEARKRSRLRMTTVD
jgi:hypothetical protein